MGEKSIAAASSKWDMAHDFFSSRQSFFFLFLLIAGVVAVYANSLGGPFVWDDEGIIKNSAEIAQKGSAGELLSPGYWQKRSSIYRYRPLRAALFSIEYSLWGFNPKGYHAVNILLHLTNVLLLYAAARSLVKDMELSFFVALIFAVHPVHSESVAYVKNATDLLAMMFILLSFLAFKKSCRPGCAHGGSASCGAIFYLLSILFFLLALFSKEMIISAPLLILLFIYLFAQKEVKMRLYLRAAPFFALAAAYGYFLLFVIKGRGGEDSVNIMILSRIGIVFNTLAYYVKLLLVPTPLNADALIDVPVSLADPRFLVSPIFILLLAFMAFKLMKASKVLFFAIGWSAITLLPVSNFLLISGRLVAEERLYIPAAGYAALITIAGLRCSRQGCSEQQASVDRSRLLARIFLIAIALFFSIETIARNNIWSSDIALWTNTVSRSPSKVRPNYNLARAYMKNGNRAKEMAQYKLALALSKSSYLKAEIYNSMGVRYADMGFEDRGMENLKKALLVKPLEAIAHYNLGDLLVKKGRLPQGISELQRAVQADPTMAEAYNNLSATYGELGQLDMAIREAKNALLFDQDNSKAYNNLATAYGSLNYVQRAVLTYKRSLAANPLLTEAHLGLGAIFLNRLNDSGRAQHHLTIWERLSSTAIGKGDPPVPSRHGLK